MCNWQRVEVELPPKERNSEFSITVVVIDYKYPTQWFMGWYDFINRMWSLTAINSSWDSNAVTHWASVELPGE